MAANRLEQARATLGVSEANSMDEAKKAYRTMMLKTHPDKNPDDPEAKERFRQVVDAWELIQMCNNNDKEYDSCDAEGDYVDEEDEDFGFDNDMFNEAMQMMLDEAVMTELFSRMRFSHGPAGMPGVGKRHHSRRGQRYGRNGGRSQFPFPGGMFPDSYFDSNSGGGRVPSRCHDVDKDNCDIDGRCSYPRSNGFASNNTSRDDLSSNIPQKTSFQSQFSTFAEAAQESCSNKQGSGNPKKKKGKKRGKKKK